MKKPCLDMMGLIVFLSFFAILPNRVTAQPTVSAKPLARLMELALENSPTISAARKNAESAKLQRKNSTARLLPSLDLEARQGIADADPRGASGGLGAVPPYTSGLDLRLTEKLYDNGESLTRRKIALRAEERAEQEFQLTRDEQLLRLAQAYYAWSEQAQSRAILDSRLQILESQYKILRGQFRQGMKTKRDVLRIETELRRSELDRVKLDNDIVLARLEVANIAGVKPELLAEKRILPASPDASWTPPEVKETPDIKNHRRNRILALQLEESQLEVNIKKRQYWPEISIDGSIGYVAQDYFATGLHVWESDSVNWQAMLTLRYNLLDFGIRRREAQIAKLAAESVSESNRKAEIDLANEVQTNFLRLQESRETIRLAKELLGLEQNSFNAQERDFRDGRTSYLDLITNLNSLIDAKSKFISAYFGYKTQQVNYAFHQGRVQDVLAAE